MRFQANNGVIFAVALAAAVAVGSRVVAQPTVVQDSMAFEHQFNGDEEDPGPATEALPGYAPWTPSTPASGTFLPGGVYQDDFNDPVFSTVYYSLEWGDEADDAQGWSFEISLKVDLDANVGRNNTVRIGDAENAGPNAHEFFFFHNDRIEAGFGIEKAVVFEGDLTDRFHQFRVTQTSEDNTFYAYLDSVEVYSAPARQGSLTGEQMWWGCGGPHRGISCTGVLQVDYVRWTGLGSFLPGAQPPEGHTLVWNTNGGGDWNSGSNWVPTEPFPISPNANDLTATFSGAATGGATVYLDTEVTVNKIVFNNTNTYAVVGLGTINLEAGDVPTGPDTTELRNPVIQLLGTGDTEMRHDPNGLDLPLIATGPGVPGDHELQTVISLNNDTEAAIGTGSSLTLNHTLNLNGNTLTKTGPGMLNINNRVNLDGGSLALSAGVLGGAGAVGGDLANAGGTVAPGNSAGVFTVEGNYSHDASSTLAIEIGGLTRGQEHDVLEVGGQIQIDGGMLQVMLIEGFTPTAGDAFDILDFGSLAGVFDIIELPVGNWDTGGLMVDGSVTYVGIPEPSAICLVAFCLIAPFLLGSRKRSRAILTPLLPALAVLANLSLAQMGTAGPLFPVRDSSAFDHKYEGDVFGAFSRIPNYTLNGFADFHRTDGDILLLNHNATTPITGPWFVSNDYPNEAEDAGGWTGEIRFKLDPLIATDVRQLQFRIGDAEHTNDNPQQTYRFFKDTIQTTSPRLDIVTGEDLTSDFHVLRVAQPPGLNLFYQWLDGRLLDVSFGGDSTSDSMYFGGNERNMEGLVQIDYVRWTGEAGFECSTCDSPAALVPQWTSNFAGMVYEDADNWLLGEVQNSNTATAIFGSDLYSFPVARTVIVDIDVTAKEFQVNNGQTFNFGGRGSVNLEADSGDASINVTQGTHQFGVVVNLGSNTDVDIDNGASLTFNNLLNLNEKTLTKTGAGTMNVNNRLTLGGGSVALAVGVLGGSGAIGGDLTNTGGTVAPGNSPGTLTVEGDFTQDLGTLALEIGGLVPSEGHDRLVVNGDATVNGTVTVELIDGFNPQDMDTFDVLDFTSFSGNPTFDFTMAPLGGGLTWDMSRFSTDGLLCAGSCVIGPGFTDFDNSGFWDLTDLNLVLFNWQQDEASLPVEWVHQRPTTVGLDSLNLVLFNWQQGSSLAAVPEPGTCLLMLIGLVAVWGWKNNLQFVNN